ncbi:hypothetical protein [Pseudalkalibacillus hwajinpoensis]|uniref:Lipoprotein n=1 Tax=Guptibacillus hwajinpoensis TaxID=208199 RepID=A0A4U1MIE3_9BACL|nr:hypothetical protein [Pseudalkalibacillus hwajinpoensis]TKD70793.1 hypothetical protein FBF83_09270 [Pseudalkalibacillus hwajinpoensis]
MRLSISLLIILSLFLGGCQELNDKHTTDPENLDPEELPQVRAFEDEFTRGFLQSTVESKEGYYPFLSDTGNYEMNFPAGGVIGEKGYYVQKGTEKYSIGIEYNKFNARINIKYYQFMKNEYLESRLQTLEESFGIPLQFQEKKLDGRSLQKAFYKDEDGYFGVVAMIQNIENSGAIEVTTVSECSNNDTECDQVIQDTKDVLYKWMESIKFIKKS